MTFRSDIEAEFEGKAFLRPLFYNIPGGLRIELAESGSSIDRFLTAHRKAYKVCQRIFSGSESLVVCLRQYCSRESPFSLRRTLKALQDAEVRIPRERELWLVEEEDSESTSIFAAFSAPVELLPRLLWCALSSDFGAIQPRPYCSVYLFNLSERLLAFPYDDRGMDVVGPNVLALAGIYRDFKRFLLDHDMPEMRRTFESRYDL